MEEAGWVSIHRKIEECSIWSCNDPYDKRSAWIDLILMANHEDKEILVNSSPLIVHRGQRFTSVRKLSLKWGWSKTRVERYLRTLVDADMVTTGVTHNGTLITIVNYDKYQHFGDTCRDTNEDTKRTSTRTRKGHPRVTNNNDNNDNNVTMKTNIEASPLTDPWGNELQ